MEYHDARRLEPVALQARIPTLDVLRGVAVLGILPVNLQLMRGPDVLLAFAGHPPELTSSLQRIVSFVLGWLFAGKFLASFAILFGVGAALTAERARRRGVAVRRLLVRRYAWLLVFGLLHMLLLYPGDILFVYGLTGLLLTTMLDLSVRARLATAAVTGGLTSLLVVADRLLRVSGGALDARAEVIAGAREVQAAADGGGVLDVLAGNLWQAILVQGSQLAVVPWILALFLVGTAAADAGWATDPWTHRTALRRVAIIGLLVGLPANLAVGLEGPLGIGGTATSAGRAVLVALATMIGAPVLAAGLLCAITLGCLRFGAPARLAAVGRLALSAYVAQSLVAAVVFVGFSHYGRLDVAGSLLVGGAIWLLLLVACPPWAARFGRGPLERGWRRLTYAGRGN